MPAFAFTAKAGPHLPTPEGWKAELAFGLRIRTIDCLVPVVDFCLYVNETYVVFCQLFNS